MEVIFLLIGCSLLVAILFLGLFFWAVRNGQYDDSHTPAMRILFDEKEGPNNKKSTQTTNTKNSND